MLCYIEKIPECCEQIDTIRQALLDCVFVYCSCDGEHKRLHRDWMDKKGYGSWTHSFVSFPYNSKAPLKEMMREKIIWRLLHKRHLLWVVTIALAKIKITSFLGKVSIVWRSSCCCRYRFYVCMSAKARICIISNKLICLSLRRFQHMHISS